MAETIKDIIARMQEQKNSQVTPTKSAETGKFVSKKEETQIPPEFDQPDDEDLEDVEETKELTPEQQQMERVIEEIELLQNDGRFRAELLHQLQQNNSINKEICATLVVIASAIVNLKNK